MFWLEKKLSQRTNTVIALTEQMAVYAKEKYGATFKNYYVKPAMVDLKKFEVSELSYQSSRKELNLQDKVVCIYAGKLGGIYLEEEVFDFIKVAYGYWGKKLHVFLLTNKDKKEVDVFLKSRNIPVDCVDVKFVPYDEIHTYFRCSDFAINPVKPVLSKRYCTSIKDGEYWAAGLPVVIPKNISDDSSIIDENGIGYVLKNLNEEEYENACIKIEHLLQGDRLLLRDKIKKVADKYRNFNIAEEIYKEVYS